MEMDMSNDFERIIFFEHARRTAEATYAENPLDTDNLTQWGGLLLELSQFQDGPESKKMVQDAVDKLLEALVINPQKHDALWCLGNAHTASAFLIPDFDEAKAFFDKATKCFEQACELDPQNGLYKKSLEVAPKALELHVEIHKHGLGQQVAMGPGPTSPSGPSVSTGTNKQQSSKKSISSDLKYDICGWLILAVGIVTWVGFAKSNVPPPPSRF